MKCRNEVIVMKYEMINHRDGEIVEADRLYDLVEYMENYNLTDNWITIKEVITGTPE